MAQNENLLEIGSIQSAQAVHLKQGGDHEAYRFNHHYVNPHLDGL